MNDEIGALADLLRNKRIGLIGFARGEKEAGESAITAALQRSKALFAHLDSYLVRPGAKDLSRYDALILYVGADAPDSDWVRPARLQANSRPLILTGDADAVLSRISLQEHADDTLFEPFSESEVVFRLAKLTKGILAPGILAAGRSAATVEKPCVVVADDDRDIVMYLKNVFGNFDVDAHFVSDGRHALTAARQLLPDLLLLDVQMPFLNGIDVLRALRKDPGTSAIRTMLLTASADPVHVDEGADLGAIGYILKPFGHMELIRKLKPLLQPGAAAA